MSEEQQVIEKEIVPKPEGYELVVYSDGLVTGIVLLAIFLFPCLLLIGAGYQKIPSWAFIALYFGFVAFVWLIMRKLTEATVTIKLNAIGFEQTKQSGAKSVPEHLLIEWKDMKKFSVNRGWGNTNIVIFRKNGRKYRAAAPWPQIIEKKENGFNNFVLFQFEFIEMAEMNGIRRGFWSKG